MTDFEKEVREILIQHGLYYNKDIDTVVSAIQTAVLKIRPKKIREEKRVLMQPPNEALTVDYFRDGYEEGFNAAIDLMRSRLKVEQVIKGEV